MRPGSATSDKLLIRLIKRMHVKL